MYLLSALFSAFFSTLAPLHKIISVNWRFFKPKRQEKTKKSPFRVQEQITWKIALCPPRVYVIVFGRTVEKMKKKIGKSVRNLPKKGKKWEKI